MLGRSAAGLQLQLAALRTEAAWPQHERKADRGQSFALGKQSRLCQHIPGSVAIPLRIELIVHDEAFSASARSKSSIREQLSSRRQGAFQRLQAVALQPG